jgi:phosphoserine aminotransferase
MRGTDMAVYFTPGPSQPYPGLKRFLDEAWDQNIMSVSHRGRAFQSIYRRTDTALRELMDIPKSYKVLFLGSATEAMERVIQGTVAKRSHHFINGAFAEKWYEISMGLGKQPSAQKINAGINPVKLDTKVPDDAELLCVTQNETSNGMLFPEGVLSEIVKPLSSTLVALDVVSSAPIMGIPWENIDAAFFSVQKVFGLPAGLGVLITGPRALEKASLLEEQGISIGSYHSLVGLASKADNFETPATPNVLNIFLLGKVAEAMLSRGIKTIRKENKVRAEILYELLNNHDHVTPFVADTKWQSPVVVVGSVNGGSSKLHESLTDDGIIVGKGYAGFKNDHIRIANFPSINDMNFEILITKLRKYKSI